MATRNHPPAFPFYPDDFAADGVVEAMSTEAVGAYILILCKAWRENPVGTIPDDDKVLARWARLSSKAWASCRESVLAAFSDGDDGRFHQKRMMAVYQEMLENSAKKGRAGKVGAQKRWDSKRMRVPSSCHTPAIVLPMANDSSASASASALNNSKARDALRSEADRLIAAWNSTPGTKHCPGDFSLPLTDLGARLTDPEWVKNYPQALAKFPLQCLGSDKMDLWRFLEEDTMGKILCGRYEFNSRLEKNQPAKLPTLAEARAARGKHD